MRIEFFNRDYPKLSIRAKAGRTDSNFGLEKGRHEVVDGGPNSVQFAWKSGNERITDEEYSKYSSGPTSSTTIVFGTPIGEVGASNKP